jgi:ATP-dependent DNA helicase RecG
MSSMLDQNLADVSWLPEPRAKLVTLLSRLEIRTWRQLLEHYPRRYEDRTEFARFPTGGSDIPICVRGMVQKVTANYFGGRKIVEMTLEDPAASVLGGRLVCRWFNQHYIQKMLATGQEVIVFGRPKESKRRIYMDHPEFEIVEDEGDEQIHMNRITPIYSLSEGVRQRVLRSLMFRAVQELTLIDARTNEEIFPQDPSRLSPMAYWTYVNSTYSPYHHIHFPASWALQKEARDILALSEFVALRLIVEQRKRTVSMMQSEVHVGEGSLTKRFLRELPFQPTGAQVRAIAEIRASMEQPVPMNRLLQGDVGAGKTMVAAAAILFAVEAGFQAALMAPTQVLAEQHYENFRRWMIPLGVRISLRTSARQEESHLELAGEPQVLIGTHALLYDAPFERLGLVVIDEQHKFGVLQRAKLLDRRPAPDLLVMTATPIPRTLAMTVYGDLEISVLDEKPANRRPIVTRVRSAEKVPEAAAFVSERVSAGRQAYIIYPVIDESETLSVKAATTEFGRWQKLLAPVRCGLLHGRLSTEEKESVMEAYRKGTIDVLISTTVIEVGVDVPNATVMLIENSERFGLAQLHQLRGRIGRSQHQSYCVLLTDREDPAVLEKLRILEQSENGFEIAEADLKMRGPGDLLGTNQSGLPPLKLGNLVNDAALLDKAQIIAAEILKNDPDLEAPENRRWGG